MKTREREKESRDSIVLMLLILLLGFICIIITSGWALRFSPSWRLPTNMGSNLNPDSDFLTRPVELLEPLDPAILTDPAWNNVFLTPSASFATHPPLPTITSTPAPTNTHIPTVTSSPTFTPLPTATNTLIFFPPSSPTPRPTRPPRDTPTASPVPVLSADLQITKTDNVGAYITGGTLTYTILVTNNGPDNVNSATVTDNFPAQVAGANWTCVVVTGGATCTASGTGNISELVSLPAGSSISYTVNVTIASSATGNLTNTATVGSSVADPAPGNNSASDTDTQFISADLSITKDDGVATYVPGGTLVYTITVTNNSGNTVVDAVVTDIKPAQITTWDWVCSAAGGASGCDGVTGSTTNFSDNMIILPVGGSVTYTVTATVDVAATGNLSNEAVIGFSADDPDPSNNRFTDIDTP